MRIRKRTLTPLLVLAALFAVAAVGGVSGRQATQPEEILIGEFGSLTGSTATFGISTRKGIDVAVEAVNKSGGLLGKKVRVIIEDDGGHPESARDAVEKLITMDHVIALLGEVASSRSLAAAPVAQRYGVPMVSPSSTNPLVTRVGNYIFRVCFIDPFHGFVMAKFIGGDSIHGSYFSNHYAADDPNPANQKLRAEFNARYDEMPDALAVLGYEAANMLFDAIRRANSTEPQKLRDALAKTKDFPGVMGKVTLDADRNALKPAVVLQIKDGKFIYVETVAAPTESPILPN